MFTITMTDDALDDLKYLKKHEQILILDTLARQLEHEPTLETRNRKPLRPNELSRWELRIDRFRVFYDVEDDDKSVLIKAIGWKNHHTLYIRGREFEL
ncbi:hypothetical protein BH23PLA1_BH23PLA1_01500 [soil metagenome]